MADPRKVTRYGPRLLGEEAFEKQQEEKEYSHREATVYGPRMRVNTDLPTRTHSMNVTEAREFVNTLSLEQLEAVEAGETAHPDYDGGRKGIFDAIAERRAELEQAHQPEQPGGGEGGDEEGEGEQEGPTTFEAFLEAADTDDSGYINLDELRATLEKHPDFLEAAVQYEFDDGEPRKGALELFLEIEQASAEPRDSMLKLFASHLED